MFVKNLLEAGCFSQCQAKFVQHHPGPGKSGYSEHKNTALECTIVHANVCVRVYLHVSVGLMYNSIGNG